MAIFFPSEKKWRKGFADFFLGGRRGCTQAILLVLNFVGLQIFHNFGDCKQITK